MKSSGVASGSNFDRGIRSITTSLQRRRIQHAVAAFLVFTFVGQSSFWRNSTSSAIRTEYKTNADRSTHASKSASDVAETDQLLPFVSNICEFLEDDMAEDRHDQDNIMEDVKLCTSEVFDFTYIRNVGKLGGTYIQKLYLIPVLCKILPEVTNSTLSESQTKLFGGASVPSDCEKTLARKRWLECGSFNLLDDPTPILGRSLVFTAVRNPYMRSVSIYKYIVEKFESKSHKTVMNFTECFGGYHESLDACLADKGNGEFHWKEQVSALQPICSAMKLQRRQQKHQLLHSSTTNSNEIIGNHCYTNRTFGHWLRHCYRKYQHEQSTELYT